MTTSYEVTVNEEQLREAIDLFEFIGGNVRDAQRISINRTGPKVRTKASREIRNQVRLKAAYVNQRLSFVKATSANLSGRISTPSRGLLLSRFSTDATIASENVSWIKPPLIPRAGIKVKVKPVGGAKLVSGDSDTKPNKPFYMAFKNGRVGIVARRNTPGSRGGKIKVFHGPSLSQVFNSVRQDVLPEASQQYEAELIDAMRYILQKRSPPE